MLHNDGIAITAEKINTILKAAGVTVVSYWPSLFAKLAQNKSIDDLVLNASAAGGAAVAVSAPAAAAAGGAAAAAAPAAEAKKEEAKEESDDDMGFSLFD
ncbi:large ribosomal subunit protein P1-like [Cicer arietinum]|uniref:60S acidic ribosomal protein P1-like n=1 Tax=Cicer arietinum TaxID=3827 RepID=A0A1S3E061_CICAR|nr:60S acidic ribosomal protein P1-like [Cicer arietinum]